MKPASPVPAPAVRVGIASTVTDDPPKTGKALSRFSTRRTLALLAALALIPCASAAENDGGWRAQQIPLVEGWNLVWLEVDPEPADTATVFDALITADVLEAVWKFSPAASDDSPGFWLVYDVDAPAFVNTLSVIKGGRGYFIHVNAAHAFTVNGRPIVRGQTLSGSGATLIGASIDATNPPDFGEFFAFGDLGDKITSIHRFDTINDDYELLVNPLINQIDENIGYWVSIDQTFPYKGPIHVSGPHEGCQFRTDGYSKTVIIEVPVSDVDETITVRALPSEIPPNASPTNAGGPDVWLQYRDEDETWQFFPLPPGGVTLTVLAGQSQAGIDLADGGRSPFEIRARRLGLATAYVDDPLTPSLYQGLIEVADSKGNVVVLGAGAEKPSIIGTWTGVIELTDVTPHSAGPNPETAAKPRSSAVVLEIPPPGSPPRLLNKACVALSRDGATMRYAFDPVLFPDVLEFVVQGGGNFHAGDAATATHSILGRYDPVVAGGTPPPPPHPLNPYRHRYNPKHRNGYDITRLITLTLDDSTFNKGELTDLIKNSALIGTYSEQITGLSSEPLVVAGTFRLYRLSNDLGLDARCACGLPNAGDCSSAHSTTGCSDAGCCQLVCESLPECCEVEWVQLCVDEATMICLNP